MCSVYSFLSTAYISSKRAWVDTVEHRKKEKKNAYTHTHTIALIKREEGKIKWINEI